MHVIHPSLKFNQELDAHFLKVLENVETSSSIKMLDENNSTAYKDLLINSTRDLYIREQERNLNKQRYAYQRKMGDENFLNIEEQDKIQEAQDK
jgi:hypothetical protein